MDGLSGMHMGQEDGILLMCGPNIRKHGVLEAANILDITPTLLHVLDLPVGDDMDGRVLEDAFEASYLLAHPITRIESWDLRYPRVRTLPKRIAEDEALVRKLRALGYVD